MATWRESSPNWGRCKTVKLWWRNKIRRLNITDIRVRPHSQTQHKQVRLTVKMTMAFSHLKIGKPGLNNQTNLILHTCKSVITTSYTCTLFALNIISLCYIVEIWFNVMSEHMYMYKMTDQVECTLSFYKNMWKIIVITAHQIWQTFTSLHVHESLRHILT